jgi:hypothetical protein
VNVDGLNLLSQLASPLKLRELRTHHDPGSFAVFPHECTAVFLQLALVISTQELLENVAPAGQVIELLRGKVALADQALQALVLLLGVLLVGANLREGLDVVLGVLVLQGGGKSCGLLDTIAVGVLELLDNSVEGLDGATSGIKTATDGAVGAGVLVEILDERVLGTGTLVRGGLERALLEELDCRVRRDALLLGKSLRILSFGIDLGDQDVGLVNESIGKSLPDGSEGLAVWNMSAIEPLQRRGLTYGRTRAQ